MTDHLTSRAQRLIDEFEEGGSVRHGIAKVLTHLTDNYGDVESWYAVPASTLVQLAAELTAPCLLTRALAGDKAEPVSDGPAVPDDREPASVTTYPTDKELLELMPETMRDEFSYAAKVCSDATGGQVKPGIFRVALNTAALEYAQAVLARWGK